MTTTDQKAGTQCIARHGSAGTPRRNALAVAGFGVACMLACSLPLLIGGGAAAALGVLFRALGCSPSFWRSSRPAARPGG